jgi:hypothetical protein
VCARVFACMCVFVCVIHFGCVSSEGGKPYAEMVLSALETFSQEDLRAFVRFVWARSRLPQTSPWKDANGMERVHSIALPRRLACTCPPPPPPPAPAAWHREECGLWRERVGPPIRLCSQVMRACCCSVVWCAVVLWFDVVPLCGTVRRSPCVPLHRRDGLHVARLPTLLSHLLLPGMACEWVCVCGWGRL